MKIGTYKIYGINSGYISLDGGAMFGVVPKNIWSKTNPADAYNRIRLALRTLLIRGDDKLILVDTGVGYKLGGKLSNIYDVDHQENNLVDSLENLGVSREEITDVIITHLHFDHIGGATYRDEKDRLQLTFPNALHHVQGEQWHWAMNPSEKDRASFMAENYVPIKEAGKLVELDGPKELFPGIEVLVFYGHTQGMQLPKISDGENTLLYCADLIPTASHIPLPFIMAYDNNPMISLQEKKRILPKAVEDNWVLAFEHDPFRAAATVEENEKGFKMYREVKL